MLETSSRLGMPYLQQGQAQKHVTHNEALELLDLLVQLTVEAFEAQTPPAAPEDGQVWALGPEPEGAWTGYPSALAAWSNGGWLFVPPATGWRAACGDTLRVWTGSAWVAPRLPDLTDLAGLGINAAYDPQNRLAVSAEATLFNHDGADHRLKINKAGPDATGTLLFQSDWSGRAEMGLAGDDDFSIKVSASGSSWFTGMRIAAADGRVTLPAGLTVNGAVGGTAVTQSANDSTAGRLVKVGDFGLGSQNLAATGLTLGDWRNTSAPTGFHHLGNDAQTANKPAALSGSGWGAGLTVRNTGGSLARFGWRQFQSATEFYMQKWTEAGGWGPLLSFFNSHNAVGTVSQSGGTPGGALMERGSNANGSYLRLADGTQLCWNADAPIVVPPAAFAGTVSKIDGDKLWIGRWY